MKRVRMQLSAEEDQGQEHQETDDPRQALAVALQQHGDARTDL
jgi:hypothetical protein